MTDHEKMQLAKTYIDKLANGIDPITNCELSHDTVLNNIHLTRCFFYVSDVLRQVIENGGEVGRPGKKEKKPTFSISNEEAARVPVSDSPVMISQFCKTISATANNQEQKPLSPKLVSDWLVKKGFLKVEELTGKTRKRVTAHGTELGISEEAREGQYGGYIAIIYSAGAQQFILDNLSEIIGG